MATYIKKYSDFIGGEKKSPSIKSHVEPPTKDVKTVNATNDTIKDDIKNAIEKRTAFPSAFCIHLVHGWFILFLQTRPSPFPQAISFFFLFSFAHSAYRIAY